MTLNFLLVTCTTASSSASVLITVKALRPLNIAVIWNIARLKLFFLFQFMLCLRQIDRLLQIFFIVLFRVDNAVPVHPLHALICKVKTYIVTFSFASNNTVRASLSVQASFYVLENENWKVITLIAITYLRIPIRTYCQTAPIASNWALTSREKRRVMDHSTFQSVTIDVW